jgi:hypothetical protein
MEFDSWSPDRVGYTARAARIDRCAGFATFADARNQDAIHVDLERILARQLPEAPLDIGVSVSYQCAPEPPQYIQLLTLAQDGSEAAFSAFLGRQGVRSHPESGRFEYRAVIDRGNPEDEQVGQRWGKVESALWGRRRYSFTIAPRRLPAARYGRFTCDPRRRALVPVNSWGKRPHKPKAKWEAMLLGATAAPS